MVCDKILSHQNLTQSILVALQNYSWNTDIT